jgi:molybdenum cofactor biosynthesis enzyme MoaA
MSGIDELTRTDFERARTVPPAPLVDPFARAITYLRVSVTDRCDFRCVYCMSENMTFLPKADVLSTRACASCASPAASRWSGAVS